MNKGPQCRPAKGFDDHKADDDHELTKEAHEKAHGEPPLEQQHD